MKTKNKIVYVQGIWKAKVKEIHKDGRVTVELLEGFHYTGKKPLYTYMDYQLKEKRYEKV